MSDYILTYSKEHFSPINPKEKSININDIAHSLSLMCRANGHIKNFFSVAQHSINCAKEAKERNYSKKVQLACLLHDGSEAYLADITRPVKKHLEHYLGFEKNLQNAIYKKFLPENLSEEEKLQVNSVDDCMLYHEFIALLGEKLFNTEPEIKSNPSFEFVDFNKVESEFLSIFKELTNA
ncbi:hypothetical protein [Clostridium thermobutyricum]|uniref:HD domain-containing protein n=1 Tax=Clostridium thermobutyricum TaxID=29372 RepID=N9XWG2_9CLOT|nr:hypothetical protein [Clostridium thermobutyricum]ENZ00249.1 hypothetical protein HMPREF1092_02764 [Clostridium thermobutyricum]